MPWPNQIAFHFGSRNGRDAGIHAVDKALYQCRLLAEIARREAEVFDTSYILGISGPSAFRPVGRVGVCTVHFLDHLRSDKRFPLSRERHQKEIR